VRVPAQLRNPVFTVAALLGGWALLARLLPRGLPPGVILLGVVLGSVTALTAMGLVLVYRAARVINFAQVAVGSAAATGPTAPRSRPASPSPPCSGRRSTCW